LDNQEITQGKMSYDGCDISLERGLPFALWTDRRPQAKGHARRLSE
jgi:hypothetical protein